MKKWLAITLNVIAPGAGLILLRREWLGTLLAVFFTALGTTGLWGLLIVPAQFPAWMVTGTLIAAGLTWLWAQWLLVQRAREACSPALAEELERLCRRADECVRQSDLQAAYRTLLIARSLNDEDVEVTRRWAELMTLMGRFRHARRAWHALTRLDPHGPYARTAVEALNRLPA